MTPQDPIIRPEQKSNYAIGDIAVDLMIACIAVFAVIGFIGTGYFAFQWLVA